jgi:nucleotide-binding universal stress UspA family protein
VAFKHILHPTGCTGDDRAALIHAVRIALAADGELTVFHVEDDEDEQTPFPRISPLLESWNHFGDHALRVKKIRQREGSTVQSIVTYARRHTSDIIVLGTHQRHGLARFPGLEVAQPVARESRSVTLFVPAGCEGFVDARSGELRLRSVLIPVDHTPAPERASGKIVSLIRQLGLREGTLHFLHIGAHRLPVAVPPLDGWRTSFETGRGPVVDSILRAARNLDAGLIVTPTEGHHGFLDALRGSTSERIVRDAQCPVLAVPALEAV